MSAALTKKELANIAGYTYRRLYDIDRDLPEDQKLFVESEGGKYDLAIFVQRWVDYNVANEKGEAKSLDDAKTAHEIIKTRKTELEVAKLEGQLVDVNEVKQLWGGIASTVMQNMMRLPNKIAVKVANMESVQTIQAIIDNEIRDVLISISETPLPDADEAHEETNEASEET
ncbi:MAG: hypothetical protein E7322_05710 [Clostridiales bacterium]|nr:hypothetical protein [Clostridiales bacterium]